MIIVKTIKGKGVPSVEDINGYHGKALGEDVLDQLGGEKEKLTSVRCTLAVPEDRRPEQNKPKSSGKIEYNVGDQAAPPRCLGNSTETHCSEIP